MSTESRDLFLTRRSVPTATTVICINNTFGDGVVIVDSQSLPMVDQVTARAIAQSGVKSAFARLTLPPGNLSMMYLSGAQTFLSATPFHLRNAYFRYLLTDFG